MKLFTVFLHRNCYNESNPEPTGSNRNYTRSGDICRNLVVTSANITFSNSVSVHVFDSISLVNSTLNVTQNASLEAETDVAVLPSRSVFRP